jgi:gas vesicle protein
VQKQLYYFIGGLGAGMVSTLLWTPKSGRETRRLIGKKVGEGKKIVARGTATAIDAASSVVDAATSVYDTATRAPSAMVSAVTAGKRAFASKF